MDQIFLSLRNVLFARVFLVLEAQHGKCTLPHAEADPLVAVFPHLIVSPYLPGSIGGGVNDAGANGPGVVCPDAAIVWRTVLVVDAALREVSKSVFGICQLAEREGKSWHWKLPVEVVVAGGADPAEHV